MRPAYLLTFHRDRHRAAQNDQVIENPHQADDHREYFVGGAVVVTPDAHHDPQQVEQHQEDIGPGNHPVDILFLYQPAFRGNVEFPFMRVDQRHHRRRRDIPGQHRFVDFTPEGVAVFPLNLRVGEAGVNHVRQHKQRNHQRGRIDDIGVQQQESQRRRQEDEPWNTR